MARFVSLEPIDVRFPTSRHLDGSDAMNPEPDYSAAYVVVRTDADDGLEGNAFTFTTGRGNDVQTLASSALAHWLIGRDVDDVLSNLGPFARELTNDPQLRWLGPEKGVVHMACGALINALWDLRAKREGLPLWQLLSRLSPEELVELVDFRYLTDAMTRDDALALLRAAEATRPDRERLLAEEGYPAYTTTPGWRGYVALSGTTQDRFIEYVDHLDEHLVDPAKVTRGRYVTPTMPGSSAEMHQQSVLDHHFPDGPVWRDA